MSKFRKRRNRRACRVRRHLGKLFPVYDCCFAIARAGRAKNGGLLIWYGSTRTLAEETGMSVGAAHRALGKLIQLGWLILLPGQRIGRITIEIDCQTGMATMTGNFDHAGVSVRYRVLDHEEWLAADSSRKCPTVGTPEDAESVL